MCRIKTGRRMCCLMIRIIPLVSISAFMKLEGTVDSLEARLILWISALNGVMRYVWFCDLV